MSSANLPVRFRILLFGVQRLLADALHTMIEADAECTVVGKVNCFAELSALLASVQPSHLIVDFDLPDALNLPLAEQIATKVTLPIIALTTHTRADLLYQLMPLNFQALLTKDINGQELIRTLKLLKDGGGKRFCHQPLFIIWPTVKLPPPSLHHL
jgi:DNA-binding NarL/FixJ family response regulator